MLAETIYCLESDYEDPMQDLSKTSAEIIYTELLKWPELRIASLRDGSALRAELSAA